jgi:hypothetical protein
MTFKERSLIVGSLFVFASVLFGAARYYSPSLVRYVVEQSLVQKAPSGIDSTTLHERFRAYISSAPDSKSRMERLIRISGYLEKVQHLTLEQLNDLLPVEKR